MTMSLKQEDPEAIGDHDPLWSGSCFTCTWQRVLRDSDQLRRRCSYCNSAWWARSNRGNLLGWHLNFALTAECEGKQRQNAPNTPTLAIHQMCQIIAKPMTTAKKAVTKPVALFFGISIGSYLRVGVGSSFVACARLLAVPERVHVRRPCGWKAKFQAGGGDAVAHSSVRPFHGSRGHVAQLLAIADRHNELHDLADDAAQDDDGADRRDYQPRLPATDCRNAACAGSCPSGPARRAA